VYIDGVDIPVGKIFGAIMFFVIGIVVISSVYTVGTGERGVLLTWGSPSMDAVEPGLHFKVPIMQGIEKMDVQTLKYTAMAGAASKDLQEVATEVTVNYHLDYDKVPRIYQNVGRAYEDKIIAPIVQEVVKSVTANFDASELITKRADAKAQVDEGIATRLAQYDIIVEPAGVLLTDFQFSDEFSKAIEEKVTAVQKKQKAENDLARIEIEAKQKIAQSKADEKYATPNMIELKKLEMQRAAVDKWNGVMPQILNGGEMPFLAQIQV